MSRAFLADTSCLVAAFLSWHEHHEAAAGELERRFEGGERLVLAAHSLVECYAVLTRLPAPHRLSPADALALLRANVPSGTKIVSLDAKDHLAVLEEAAEARVAGGRIYDALIARAAREGGANVLVTLNEAHFRDLVPEEIELVNPGGRRDSPRARSPI